MPDAIRPEVKYENLCPDNGCVEGNNLLPHVSVALRKSGIFVCQKCNNFWRATPVRGENGVNKYEFSPPSPDNRYNMPYGVEVI